ncbi:Ig-like domain-containing protein, partial [Thermus sp.]|uniref:Ig-like domain-containing protein n=1 Tax=Thermus sp. TaxID=275 RepID=UPI00307F82AA
MLAIYKRLYVLALIALSTVSCNFGANDGTSSQASVSISLAIETPSSGEITNKRSVAVQASVTGASRIDKVEVYYQDNTPPIHLQPQSGFWKGELPSSLPSGEYTLKAKAYVGSLEKESQPIRFTYDKDHPSVAIDPLSSLVVKGTVTVVVRATDNVGVARVQLFAGGTLLGEQTSGVGDRYTFSVDTTRLPDGSHTLRAVAVDRSGNASEALVGVTVDNTPPMVRWVNPVDGATVGGVVTLIAEAEDAVSSGLSVTYKANGQVLADADAGVPGFQWDTSGVGGSVSLTAEATDGAGNRGTASVTVQVDQAVADRTAPVVSIDPLSSLVVKGTVTVVVRATDNVGVARVQLFAGGTLLGEQTSG